MCDSCEKTEFGCCQDLENAALGPDFQGCPDGEPKFIDCTTTVTFTFISILSKILCKIFFFFKCEWRKRVAQKIVLGNIKNYRIINNLL